MMFTSCDIRGRKSAPATWTFLSCPCIMYLTWHKEQRICGREGWGYSFQEGCRPLHLWVAFEHEMCSLLTKCLYRSPLGNCKITVCYSNTYHLFLKQQFSLFHLAVAAGGGHSHGACGSSRTLHIAHGVSKLHGAYGLSCKLPFQMLSLGHDTSGEEPQVCFPSAEFITMYVTL